MKLLDSYIQKYGILVGRFLIGLLFLFSGVNILIGGVENFSKAIEMKGLPLALLLAWLVVILKIAAGSAVILGYKTKIAALALLLFTALATLLYHASWQDMGLFKNLAIIGGLLYVYSCGQHDVSKAKPEEKTDIPFPNHGI